ncbi:MAG: hypothetical protein U5K74_02955 [Gemmatimonadaceae bacterium]|nr:hypothetical protein [Gemmatimonadaceae bacterium]
MHEDRLVSVSGIQQRVQQCNVSGAGHSTTVASRHLTESVKSQRTLSGGQLRIATVDGADTRLSIMVPVVRRAVRRAQIVSPIPAISLARYCPVESTMELAAANGSA